LGHLIIDFVVQFTAAHRVFFPCYCASEDHHQQGRFKAIEFSVGVPERLAFHIICQNMGYM